MFDQDQLAQRQVGAAYWYVTHKLLIKNIIMVIFLVFDLILIIFCVYSLILNLVIDEEKYQAGLASLVTLPTDYAFLRQYTLPPAIAVNNMNTYSNVKDSDIVAEISNANTAWSASFNYQFQLGEKLTDLRQGFIYPGETKRIMDLAVADGNLLSNVIFSNVKWSKQINFTKEYGEKFKFDVRNVKFIPAQELGVSNKIPVNRVTFEVENLSAYNYKNLNLQMFLYSGGQIAAINQIPSGTLLSRQAKSYEVNFFQNLPRIDKVEIIPEANIFDEKTFLQY